MSWDVRWPFPAAIITRRPPAPEIVTVWHGGPLNSGGSPAGHIAGAAVLTGHARARRNVAGDIISGGLLAGNTAARLSLTGHVNGGARIAATPTLRARLSGALSATSVLTGAASRRLVLSGALSLSTALTGLPRARLSLDGAIQSVVELSGISASRRALIGSVSSAAVLIGLVSTEEPSDPLRGGWDTMALDAPVMAFSNDNRTVIGHDPTGGDHNAVLSLASISSGKFYTEISIDAREYGDVSITDSEDEHYVHYRYNGSIYSSAGVELDNIGGYAAPCIIGLAGNTDDHLVWFRVNGGDWNGDSANDPETATGGYAVPISALPYHVKAQLLYFYESQRTLNTGTAAFAYPPPAGFLPLQA